MRPGPRRIRRWLAGNPPWRACGREGTDLTTIRRLRDVTFADLGTAWNEGFRGYAFDMTMSLDALVARFGQEDLSANASVVAFEEDRPIGFVLNGLRTIEGQRVAWDGGTGVSLDQRGKGVGRRLIEASLAALEEESVTLATLEALSDNGPAVHLYESFGYKAVEGLLVLSAPSLKADAFTAGTVDARFRSAQPAAVAALPFYEHFAPWQTQWQSAKGGEGLILEDAAGNAEGYALLTRGWTADGKLESITVLQAKVRPDSARPETMRLLLSRAFSPLDAPCRRIAFNVPESNVLAIGALKEAGFTVFANQVFMTAAI